MTHCEESARRDIIIRREHPGSSVLITPFVKHRFGKTDNVDYLGSIGNLYNRKKCFMLHVTTNKCVFVRTKKPFKSIKSCSFLWLLFPGADPWLISGQITPGDPGHSGLLTWCRGVTDHRPMSGPQLVSGEWPRPGTQRSVSS